MYNSILTSSHFVFIVDETGIAAAFPEIIQKLKHIKDTHLSVVYVSANQSFIFQRELNTLAKFYPNQLMLYFQQKWAVLQEDLELILNTNTKDDIYFITELDKDLGDSTHEMLHFLGIKKEQVTPFLR